MARLFLLLAALLAAPASSFAPGGRLDIRRPARVAPLLSTTAAPLPALAPEDEWIGKLDLEGFRRDIRCSFRTTILDSASCLSVN